MVRGEAQKHLDIERIAALHAACGIFMTLHGGSGTNDQDFQRAIILTSFQPLNTDFRPWRRNGLEVTLKEQAAEIALYKILPGAYDAVKAVVTARLKLFNFI